jgi:hypothetical protein
MIKDILNGLADLFIEFFHKEESWVILLLVGASTAIPFFAVEDFKTLLWGFIKLTAPIWLAFPLWFLFSEIMRAVRQEEYKSALKWAFLELRMPREVSNSPKAMEQILLAVSTLRNAPKKWKDKYKKGEVTQWFSLEIVSSGGETKFFLRVPESHRDFLEATIFSYYPEIEVSNAKDYAQDLPKDAHELEARGQNIWGTEFVLDKAEAFPIKTYPKFESSGEGRMDPISSLLEVLGKIRVGETVYIHTIIAPAGDALKKAGEGELKKLRAPETAEVGGLKVAVPHPPGRAEQLAAVEQNLSKTSFDTLIRVGYIGPKDGFADGYVRGAVIGAFNQYAGLNLNSFKANGGTDVVKGAKAPFKAKKLVFRKHWFLHVLKNRLPPPETFWGQFITSYRYHRNTASKRFLMGVEAVATIFHPPTSVVLTAPHLKRVESRKSGLPAGLQIFGGESDIEKFQ